jgi:hypothetical protein
MKPLSILLTSAALVALAGCNQSPVANAANAAANAANQAADASNQVAGAADNAVKVVDNAAGAIEAAAPAAPDASGDKTPDADSEGSGPDGSAEPEGDK